MPRHPTAPHNPEKSADDAMVILDYVVQDLFPEALRFVFDGQDAAASCSHRACRVAGACALRLQTGKPVACGGCADEAARDEAVAMAAELAMFAGLTLMRTHYMPTHAGRRVGRRTPLIPLSDSPASGTLN